MFDLMEGVFTQLGRIASKRQFTDEKTGRLVSMVLFESLGHSKNFMIEAIEDYNACPGEGTTVKLHASLKPGKEGAYLLYRPRFTPYDAAKQPKQPA